MIKQIIIVGGGISGLSTLHYLKSKYANRRDVRVQLLEKKGSPGGTIYTIKKNGIQFEIGPNGFLNSKPATLDLVRELGLTGQLVCASQESRLRYIRYRGTLYPIPMTPAELLKFGLLNPFEKLRVLTEIFVGKQNNPQETVYEFGKRRLGEKFSRIFLDPMVTGIFAGDFTQLNLQAAFPRIHEIEQTYGSLIRGMMAIKKQRALDSGSTTATPVGQPAGELYSFTQGMGQLIEALYNRYKEDILLHEEVVQIHKTGAGYTVETVKMKYSSDYLILSTPAYVTSKILFKLKDDISKSLDKISYMPVAVAGLVYHINAFFRGKPEGFGYLVPSQERKPVLGVLYSSNIFPIRTDGSHFLFRVMLGGPHHRDIHHKADDEVLRMAIREIQDVFQLKDRPVEQFLRVWPNAIPQYTNDYLELKSKINRDMALFPNIVLHANYLDGISMNDCIENSKKISQTVEV